MIARWLAPFTVRGSKPWLLWATACIVGGAVDVCGIAHTLGLL